MRLYYETTGNETGKGKLCLVSGFTLRFFGGQNTGYGIIKSIQIKRLDKNVADLEPGRRIGIQEVGKGGYQNNFSLVTRLPEFFDHFQPVQMGQFQIGDDEVDLCTLEALERFFRIFG